MKIFVPALLVIMLLAATTTASAQDKVDASTLDGKVLFGYQGWFRAPGDGSNVGWSHWSRTIPSAESITVDLYPDLSEFDARDLCPVPGETIGAKPAYLFSSFNKNVVMRHFEWMKRYGLDGVLVQRFLSDIPGSRGAGGWRVEEHYSGGGEDGPHLRYRVRYQWRARRHDVGYFAEGLELSGSRTPYHRKPALSAP